MSCGAEKKACISLKTMVCKGLDCFALVLVPSCLVASLIGQILPVSSPNTAVLSTLKMRLTTLLREQKPVR